MMMERLTLVSFRNHIKNTRQSPESNLCSTSPRKQIGRITMFRKKNTHSYVRRSLPERSARFSNAMYGKEQLASSVMKSGNYDYRPIWITKQIARHLAHAQSLV